VAKPRAPGLLVLLGLAASVSAAWVAPASADPVIAAAGDIACDPQDPGYNNGNGTADRCQQRATSDLLVGRGLSAVLPLGDLQYTAASAANLSAVYDPTWGRVKSISRPILGNHESGGMAYFDYFNGKGASDGPAGPRGKGYYSFDVGGWHLVALNSNCSRVSCSAGSEQAAWLRADLAANPAHCTLAYWHDPRFSSGYGGSNSSTQALWQALDEAGVEILLSGSSHDYERLAPLDSLGNVDRAGGVRQFVVGTGGAFFTGLSDRVAASEVAQNDTFGVLMLALHPSSYDWQFVPIAGRTFTDSGSDPCHGPRSRAAPTPAPESDHVAPILSGLRVSPRRFGRRAMIRYRLSEGARVRFTIRRKMRRRYRVVGRFFESGSPGANLRRFRGRIGGRRLRAGTFRAGLKAFDAAGNKSRPRSRGFKIVRR
jgi:acid phosphatase type 7